MNRVGAAVVRGQEAHRDQFLVYGRICLVHARGHASFSVVDAATLIVRLSPSAAAETRLARDSIYLDIPSPASREAGILASDYGLVNHGLVILSRVYWNLSTAALYEEIVFRSEGTRISIHHTRALLNAAPAADTPMPPEFFAPRHSKLQTFC